MSPFFLLLRAALGADSHLRGPLTPEQWQFVFNTSKRHTIIGLMYSAVERLPKEMQPPHDLMMKWFYFTQRIRQQNALVNQRAVELSAMFLRDGFRTCVLKGQGVAALYPDPGLRQTGDIDLWVEGDRKTICTYLQRFVKAPLEMEYHHANFPFFKDVDVEVHFHPSFLHWPPSLLALNRFYKRQCDAQFSHRTTLPGDAGEVCVPTTTFNLIFSLAHIYKHFFSEGVGLRHIVDYHYILRQGFSEAERDETVRWLRKIGMLKFARAMMFVQHKVLGLPAEFLLCEPDKKEGDFLMRTIMTGGNFLRRGNSRNTAGEGKLHHLLRTMSDNSVLFRHYPTPVLGYPLYSLWHFLWRVSHGYK